MPLLNLTPDEVLSTTRCVRRRLDLTRPVEREVIEECLELAQQAPRASNVEIRHFVIVTDASKKAALAELWRRTMTAYLRRTGPSTSDGQPPRGSRSLILAGVEHLGEHLHEVPVHVIPCVDGRTDGKPSARQASTWGTIDPATWSFMLAARVRGLGTCWTTFHLSFEREAAEILGIPYETTMQTALLPLAYTIGTDFKPGPREPLDRIAHWDAW